MDVVASWRAALRIAWREARRAKGRSVLVAVMLALPVLALSAAAVTSDMMTLTGAEKATQRMGAADARIEWPRHRPMMQLPDPAESYVIVFPDPGPGGQIDVNTPEWAAADQPGTQEELIEALPGSTVVPVRRGTTVVRTPDGLGQPDAVMVDATSPLTRGYVEILAGRAPAAPTEVALTKQAMAWLEAGIGDDVTVVAGETTRPYTVVGQVEFPSLLDSVLLFAYDADDETVSEWFALRENSWLVDTPEPIGWDRVLELNERGMLVASRAVFEHPPADEDVPLRQTEWTGNRLVQPEDLALAVLVGGLALLEVVLLAGPAFAISARRRQRQLALVAANGGTPAHVRRIVLADGVVLGLLGAGLGLALGITGAFLARPWFEETIAHVRGGAYRVFPEALVAIAGLAVVTGLLAALVPAFITARQDVVASLAGRRGITRSRKRWIAVGLAMIVLGAVVTCLGALAADTVIMLGGLIIGELGLVLCTPALIGLVARVGRIVPLAPRIALRDAARNRAAAAPAIAAVMAAVAGTVALGMYLDSQTAHERNQYQQETPTGTASVHFGYGGDDWANSPSLAAIEQAMRTALPVAEVHTVGTVICPDGPEQATCDLQVVANDQCPQLLAWNNGDQLTTEQRRQASANPACDTRNLSGTTTTKVIDGRALSVLTGASGDDLRAAEQVLASGGVVVRSPLLITEGKVTVAVIRPDPTVDPEMIGVGRYVPIQDGTQIPPGHTVEYVTLPGHLLTTGIRTGPAFVTPATVARLGLVSDESALVGATTRAPTTSDEERARALLQPLDAFPYIEHGFQPRYDQTLLVLLAASAIITIGAASVGTALTAADSRQDLSTLAAVGASPRLRRGLSVSQSWVIAGLGSILGSAVGLGTAIAVIAMIGQEYETLWPFDGPPTPVMPWSTLLITLVLVPAIAVLGAGLFTRSRLPIERRL
ncbi:MAG: ABC transporter permease [Micromonosporaceae bacterium]|nr:ABC transporter permease [Micromonosporaceae bacterium]